MEKIASFTINHLKLLPGVYVSRKDAVGSETLTTFDLRMTAPNREPVMNTAEMHAIEHLAATYLRNNKEWQDKIIYFGPMGCRTGFYLILAGDLTSKDMKQYAKKKKYELMTNFYLKSGKDRFWVMKPFYEENILEGRIFRYHEGKIQCVFKFREP